MLTASILLFLIGALGAFDVAFFHVHRARIVERAECRLEAWIHVARGPVYAAQFVLLPNVRLQGDWVVALWALFAIDAAIAAADVLVEPESRRSQGGLFAGEYLMHMVLSVLVGAMLHSALASAWSWRSLPTALVIVDEVPWLLRAVLLVMAGVVLCVSALDAAALVEQRMRRAPPIHVAVRLPATIRAVWTLTQDHRIHPTWDHRFDNIEMLNAPGEPIEAGTEMLYEKSILGMKIRGKGRYKLHRLEKQSTFEFWSDDPRSLIRRGVGLWLYRPARDGGVEFSTAYTYEVRWGAFGRIFDRLVFRPLFQLETERSFRRLAVRYFGVKNPVCEGAA